MINEYMDIVREEQLLEYVFKDLSHEDDSVFEWQFRLLRKLLRKIPLESIYALNINHFDLLELIFNNFSDIIENKKFPTAINELLPTIKDILDHYSYEKSQSDQFLLLKKNDLSFLFQLF